MKSLLRKTIDRFCEEDGATMVEYGLVLALIGIVCILAVQAVGTRSNALYNRASNSYP